MEEIELKSGRKVKVHFNTTTLRLAFDNPLLADVKKFMTTGGPEVELPGDQKETEEEAADMIEKLDSTMNFLKAMDDIVARCVIEPKVYVPKSLEDKIPKDHESIETWEEIDKLDVFGRAIGHLQGIGDIAPLGIS